MYWKGLFPRTLIPILKRQKGTRLGEEGEKESRGETTQRGTAEVHQKQYGSCGALLHWIRLMTGSRLITKEQRRVQSRFLSFTSRSLSGFYQRRTWGHNATCVVSSESEKTNFWFEGFFSFSFFLALIWSSRCRASQILRISHFSSSVLLLSELFKLRGFLFCCCCFLPQNVLSDE